MSYVDEIKPPSVPIDAYDAWAVDTYRALRRPGDHDDRVRAIGIPMICDELISLARSLRAQSQVDAAVQAERRAVDLQRWLDAKTDHDCDEGAEES